MKKYNFDELVDRTNTNCVKYDGRQRFFGNNELIPMWVADMDFKTPDFITEAVQTRAQHEVYGYTLRPDSTIESIVNWMKIRHNWNIQKEWLQFSPGVVPALALAIMCYSEPGDSVIVQPPVYFPFFSAIKNMGRTMIENPMKIENDRYTFDLEDLKNKIQPNTKMLLLCNPHNPGGMVWNTDELRSLGEICIEKNILVVSDEIHSDLIFSGHRHVPFASLSEAFAQNSFTCMAPSKTFNVAGLSTSFVVIPNKALFATYEKMMYGTHLFGGNLFGSIALEAAYTHGAGWLDQLVQYSEENYRFLASFLKENIPGIVPMKPEATYLVWLDFSSFGLSDEEINHKLIKAGVGLNRGIQFGTQGSGFMRMNIGCPRSVLENALMRMKKAFENEQSRK